MTTRIERRRRLTSSKHYDGMATRHGCWRGQTRGADILPLDQPAEEVVEENSLDPTPNKVRPSDPEEAPAVEPLVLDKTKKSYTVVINT